MILFLVGSSLNYGEKIDPEYDPRRFQLMEKVKEVRNKFQKEVDSITMLAKQFMEGLFTLLKKQR